MRRYISIVSGRQVDSNIYLLWDCGRFFTASAAVDFFVLTLVPLDVGVSALPVLGGPCGFLLDVLVAVDLRGLFSVVRCMFVPVSGACPTTGFKILLQVGRKKT